ncbi:hypothetical protein LF887_08485 [Chryseobacterium sp. MEBOG06]|uniref:hypothetical protein n=1 Tax=unclassified Chryseobacterium TaxID=2593645 RepID=UPI001F3945B6|nr:MULTISPECIES: hypothetical protein [unclassified Chryseobacterium]UKB85644.1 hypothetical protein LF887_08485 [Chryseobacterium sp. MEBOG06]
MNNNAVISNNAHQDNFFGELQRTRFQYFDTFPSTDKALPGWIIDYKNELHQWNGTKWINLAQNYIHPDYPLTNNPFQTDQTSGLLLLSQILTNSSGHVIKIAGRNLTNADIVSIFLNDAAQSGTFTWSSNKIKDYIENLVGQSLTGALIYQPGGYVPSTAQGSMAAPIPVTSATIKTGMVWVITANGWVGNEPVSIGDHLIANTDNGSNTPKNYQIIEKGIPDIVDATDTVKGLIQIATDVEAIAGTNSIKAMTPRSTKAVLDAKVKSHTWDIGDGTSVSFSINHGWKTSNVDYICYRNADNRKINVSCVPTSINDVQIEVLAPLTPNEYRITLTARLD